MRPHVHPRDRDRALPRALALAGAAAVLLAAAQPASAADPFARPRQQGLETAQAGTGGSIATGTGGSQVQQIPPTSGTAAVNLAVSRGTVTVEAGSGRIVTLGTAANSVFTADPKVVDVRPASPTTLFLFGVAPGKSTVAVMDAGGRMVAQWEVVVRPNSFGASEAGAAISRSMPGRNVRVEQGANGMVVTGTVATAAEADRAIAAARAYAPPKSAVENRLRVTGPQQVMLQVRVVEMSRALTRELGFNWSSLGQIGRLGLAGASQNPLALSAVATSAVSQISGRYASGGVNFNGIIDALAQDSLVHLLAEPTLTAMSGETASFLAGGEFPIPVTSAPSGGFTQITVDFKQFGVALAFVPTVLTEGQINLRVRPEVSQIVTSAAGGAVVLNGITIPALSVRRAETTVELGNGQSFAIAGLLSDNTTQVVNNFPILGDLPIIGALFRSDSFQRQETELVIVVTPYLVGPVSDRRSIATPADSWTPPNDVDRLLLLRQAGRNPVAGSPPSFLIR